MIALMTAIAGCVPSESVQRTEITQTVLCIEGVDTETFQMTLRVLHKDTDPADPSAENHFLRGVAFYCTGKLASSLHELSIALSIDPAYYEALSLRARLFSETGKTDKALADLSAAARANPENPDPLIERGNIHLSLEMYSKAGNDFVNAIKRSPRSVIAYVGLADIHAAKGEYDKALNFYDRALRLDPDSADAYTARGLTYFETSQYVRAVGDLERAGSIDPSRSIRLAQSRGYAHFHINNFKQAAEAFSEIIASEPVPPSDIVTMRALSYFNAAMYDKAIADARLAVDLAPDDAKVHYNRANFLAQLGNYNEALQSYNEAVRLDPDYFEALLNRGKVYFDTGKYFRSLIDYNRAVELRPDLVQGYVHRGSAYVAAEMYRQAEEDFTVVLEKEPGWVDIIIAMSELSALRGAALSTCVWLNKAVTLGYSDWQYVWDSPAFEPVRQEGCYKEIVPPSTKEDILPVEPVLPSPAKPGDTPETSLKPPDIFDFSTLK